MAKTYPPGTRAEVVGAYLRGEGSYPVLGARFGVHPKTVANWMRLHHEGRLGVEVVGHPALADRAVASRAPLEGTPLHVPVTADGPPPEVVERLVEAAAVCASPRTIARTSGVSLEMFREWMSRGRRAPESPLGEVARRVDQAWATARIRLLRVMYSAAVDTRDWKAAEVLLRRTEWAEEAPDSVAEDPNAGLRNMLEQLSTTPAHEGAG